MPLFFIIWDDETERHVAQNAVTSAEFDEVLLAAAETEIEPNKEPGRFEVVGETAAGRLLKCVFEYIDDVTISPVNAFKVGKGE